MNFFSSSGLPNENQIDRQNARQAPSGNIIPRASPKHCSAGFSPSFAPAYCSRWPIKGTGKYLISFSIPSDLRCSVEYQWFLIALSVLLRRIDNIVRPGAWQGPQTATQWLHSDVTTRAATTRSVLPAMRPRAQQQRPSELAIVHAPAWEELGDLGPTVAKASLRQANAAVLIRRPRILADGGVELVLEALPTLLATAALELRSDNGPLSQPVLLYQRDDQVILLLRPRPPAQRGTACRTNVSGASTPPTPAGTLKRHPTRAVPPQNGADASASHSNCSHPEFRDGALTPPPASADASAIAPAQRPSPAGARPRGQARVHEGDTRARRAVLAPW